MSKLVSFDLEISKEMPDGDFNWKEFIPLGISCAGLWLDGQSTSELHYDVPKMSREKCVQFVHRLQELVSQGYQIVTWNGCNFDFHVLAIESNMFKECSELAMNHIDLMLLVTFQKGFYLGLDAASRGAGLEGKTHKVTLKNGDVITEMSGKAAPSLWNSGETEAVLTYLTGDVKQTLDVAHAIENQRAVKWIAKSGRYNRVMVDRLRTVKECFEYPKPDTSWMTNPPVRESFIDWIE